VLRLATGTTGGSAYHGGSVRRDGLEKTVQVGGIKLISCSVWDWGMEVSHSRRPKPMLSGPFQPARRGCILGDPAQAPHLAAGRVSFGSMWLMDCIGEASPPIGLRVIVIAVR
jgi:hypothetical protein